MPTPLQPYPQIQLLDGVIDCPNVQVAATNPAEASARRTLEIADRLGRNVATVKTRAYRARAQVRRALAAAGSLACETPPLGASRGRGLDMIRQTRSSGGTEWWPLFTARLASSLFACGLAACGGGRRSPTDGGVQVDAPPGDARAGGDAALAETAPAADARAGDGTSATRDAAADGPVRGLDGGGTSLPGCGTGGFCWQNPLPQGNTLNGVWAASPTDVWAVGGAGTLRHYDGTSWSPVVSNVTAALRGVWGSSASDVWAVGDGLTLLHYTGTSWTSVSPPSGVVDSMTAVGGTSAKDVWAVGSSSEILHYDGTSWSVSLDCRDTMSCCPTDNAIWASTPASAWVGATGGAIETWSGAWSLAYAWSSEDWTGVWGDNAGHVWAVSYGGHYTDLVGTGASGTMSMNAWGIWGSGAADVWAVGDSEGIWHYGPSGWASFKAPTSGTFGLRAVSGTDATHAFAVGTSGGTLAWNGTAWQPQTPVAPTYAQIHQVWGASTSDVWAASDDGLLHFDGTAWALAKPSAGTPFFDVGGSSATDVWASQGIPAGSTSTMWHWNGSTWTSMPYLAGVGNHLWASSPTDVWQTSWGSDYVGHWNGASWDTTTLLPSAGGSIWGSGPADVWTGGRSLSHFDGSAWTTAASVTLPGYITGLWGSGPSDYWAVGIDFIMHYDGSTWSITPDVMMANLNAVSGRGPNDVWAVGDGGTVLHWDGTAWSWFWSGTDLQLSTVFEDRASGRVTTAGQYGAILAR